MYLWKPEDHRKLMHVKQVRICVAPFFIRTSIAIDCKPVGISACSMPTIVLVRLMQLLKRNHVCLTNGFAFIFFFIQKKDEQKCTNTNNNNNTME